ncbi:thioredoxin [Tamlana sedimentorum]|uniref:Thioredoxin n=1 Tax=Neotamlana sedimentorum TaxID=1435349 RepID=A0A0D7WAC7_9FLAO|nr:TlpA disulfide reductase family protein [Tamlana sedimentorum]KJD35608.1 thioredoxin [Tamlana sedimentorum]
MRKSLLLSCFSLFFLLAACGNKKNKNTSINNNQEITVYNFNTIEPLLYSTSNKTKIVNFWAMWCAPCVKELPYLQEYAQKHPNVELLLVSLDFPETIEKELKPFLKEKNITAKVIMLDDPDANSWINKIDPNWSGAIPFTIISINNKRMFYERSFENVEDLNNEIQNNF